MYLQAIIWLLALTASAHSAPLIGLITAFASTTLGGIIVNAAIGIALSIGSSLLQSLFSKKSQSRDPGTTVQLRVGGANPFMFPAGRTATAGVRAYYGVWSEGGTPNEYMTDVVMVSALPLSGGITGLYLNDQKVTIRTDLPKDAMGWPIQEYFKNGKYYAWIDTFDGNQTTANPFLRSKFGTHPNYPWNEDMIGRGVAYVTLTCRYDKDGLWSSGYPSMLIEIPSVPLYDVRKDSTAGGSGPHRWGVVSTYEPSNNAMVRAYNVARGFYFGTEWVYGGQNWPAYRLPASSWMAAMNACDIVVGGEPQFHGGGMIECDIEVATALEELLRSASGLIAEIGGQYKVRVGAPGAPVMGFTDANIIVTREQGYAPFPGLESTYNIARITYTEPGERWSTKESPERRDETAIVSDDGRELPFNVDLPWVLTNLTAQRIAKTALDNGRRFRRHSMYQAPLFWLIEPLDVVAWTSAHNQYVAKEFDVEQISGNSAMMQSIIIRENDPSDYAWNPLIDPLPYQIIPVVPDVVPPQPVTGWQVFPAIIKDETGRDRRPSIEVRFDGALTDIDRVRVQVRIEGTSSLIWDNTVVYPATPTTTAAIILNGDFPPNVACQVRGRFIPYTDRDTEWTDWLDVTTPNVKLVPNVDFDPYDGVTGFENLDDDLLGYQDWLGSGRREIERRLEEFDLWISDQDLGNAYDRQKIREQLTATYENSTAEWKFAVDVVATETTAVAQRVETLTATVNDNYSQYQSTVVTQATINSAFTASLNSLSATVFDPLTGLPATATAVNGLSAEVSVIDGILVAQAEAITSLSAATDPSLTTTANFRMSVVTGPAGYARIGAEGRSGGAGAWRTAGWYIDVPNNPVLPTRFAVQADQFVVTTNATNAGVNPMIWEGGTLYLSALRAKWANIDNVVVTNAQIANAAITSTKLGNITVLMVS